MKISDIKNNSIIFCTNQDKLEILKLLNQESLFLNLSFYNIFHSFIKTNHSYYFYLKEKYDISIDLANQIKKYFPYINISKEYLSKKVNDLRDILKDLLDKNIVELDNILAFSKKHIYSVNQMPLPSFIMNKDIEYIEFEKYSDNSVSLKKTDTSLEASYCAFEEVVGLLKNGVSINDIIILNTTKDDDYNLLKIFSDAILPITINKPIKLNTYPEVIHLLKIIKEEGYFSSKEYLNTLIKSNIDQEYLPALIKIYNDYLDSDLEKYPELLMTIINNQSISKKKYTNCINVYSIDSFSYEKEKHYIILNYSDNSIPKTANNSDYLNNYEREEIGFLNETKRNEYYRLYDQFLIRSIEHLTLIFSRYTEEENRIATLDLKRTIIEEDYQYLVKNNTYLNSLLQLEYAKTKYDFATFYLRHQNYDSLYHDYNHIIREYKHEFTGIHPGDLKYLLKQNNSITPYKLEEYTQCEFRFLLNNLLKLEAFEPNINMYLGNLSHKVLEEFTKDPSVDYVKLIDSFDGFPEEIKYKESIFKTALKKEMKELLKIVGDFHSSTMFTKILPEIKFRFPFKLDQEFDLSGIIDKVMVYQKEDKTEYFVLIDYKLGNKDFSVDKFQKNQQLQLPMYYYAYMNLDDTILNPVGFFYQTTSLGRYNFETDAILKNYRLKGVAVEDLNLLQAFDNDLNNIEGISITSTGKLSSRSRLLTQQGFQEIYETIEKKILDMIKNLKKGEFKINPIPAYGSKKDSVSCEYCSFASICYNKNLGQEVGE